MKNIGFLSQHLKGQIMKLLVGTKHREGIRFGGKETRTTLRHDIFFNMLMGTKWARDFLFNQNFILTFLNHTLAFKKKKNTTTMMLLLFNSVFFFFSVFFSRNLYFFSNFILQYLIY